MAGWAACQRERESVLERAKRVLFLAKEKAISSALAGNVKTKLSELSHLAELSGAQTLHTHTGWLVRSEERERAGTSGTRRQAFEREWLELIRSQTEWSAVPVEFVCASYGTHFGEIHFERLTTRFTSKMHSQRLATTGSLMWCSSRGGQNEMRSSSIRMELLLRNESAASLRRSNYGASNEQSNLLSNGWLFVRECKHISLSLFLQIVCLQCGCLQNAAESSAEQTSCLFTFFRRTQWIAMSRT